MSKFTKRLLEYFDRNPRNLPWKNDHDAYSIWLAEIIMQQTRVAYGKQYYLKFKQLYPTIFDLAKADLQEVLKAWEGLGYYSRARNLHATAKYIVDELHGAFPTTYKGMLSLKGIGPYTAAAILSFLHNKPIPAIDGNAYRVLARYFGIKEPIDKATGKKLFFNKGKQLIAKANGRAGDFNQAMMNFGATVCTPRSAKCTFCPMQSDCIAYRNNLVYKLPVKRKKIEYKTRFFTFFCIQYQDQFMVQERKAKDVWQNLYEFYLIESPEATVWEKLIEQSPLRFEKEEHYTIKKVIQEKQTLTHQKLKGQIVWVRFLKKPSFYDEHQWVNQSEINHLPFPKMLQNAIKMINLDFS